MLHENEALMDEPGDRLPLLTRGEARALVAVLGELAKGAAPETSRDALELQARIGMRLPSA